MSRRRRNSQEEEEPENDNFLVMFTALSMILLAFMIVLNSFAKIDDGKTAEAKKSIEGSFGALLGTGFRKPETFIDQQSQSQKQPSEDAVEDTFRKNNSFKHIAEKEGVEVRKNPQGRLVLRFDGRLLFEPGAIHLSPTSYSLLDEVANVVDDVEVPIRIEGHSSPTPYSGKYSNWYLSAARAGSAMRYLDEATDLSLDQIEAAGFGSSRPPKKEGASARRVEIVFLPPDKD